MLGLLLLGVYCNYTILGGKWRREDEAEVEVRAGAETQAGPADHTASQEVSKV
jgi:hypothetical protein